MVKCFNVTFYVSTLVGVIIKVILQNARCNDKDNHKLLDTPQDFVSVTFTE